MIARHLLAAVSLALSAPAAAQQVGEFSNHADVGEVAFKGDAQAVDGGYRVTGSGANIWGEADAFHYAWTQRSGDLHIAADIAFEGEGGDPHRKAGVMIRQNLAPGSPYADVMVHGDGLVSLQYREVPGGPTRQIINDIGNEKHFDGSKGERLLGRPYISAEDAVLSAAESVIRLGLLKPRGA